MARDKDLAMGFTILRGDPRLRNRVSQTSAASVTSSHFTRTATDATTLRTLGCGIFLALPAIQNRSRNRRTQGQSSGEAI